MSSFAWMKFLESAPHRYDRGIGVLSRGRIDDVYRRIAALVASRGSQILDIGCGTGGVSLSCAARGARVTGIDSNAGMLEVARGKVVPSEGSIEWVELGIAEIEDRFPEATFDAAVACLTFSELSPDERTYSLLAASRCLVPGGQIVIADETLPHGSARRLWRHLRSWPRSALTYLLTQTTTRPLRELPELLAGAGFDDLEITWLWSDTFVIAYGRKPRKSA